MPREIVVFPHDPFDSAAIAERLRGDGFIVLGTAPMSGMILAATAANVPGLEELMCEYVARWPEVRETGRNVAGEALRRQPAVCVSSTSFTSDDCNFAYLGNQVPDCGTPGAGIPDDDAFCHQWGLHNTGQIIVDLSAWHPSTYPGSCWTQTGFAGIDVNLLAAWERTTGSPLVTVAVLDSGIEYCNPDFDDERFFFPDLALTCEGNDSSAYPCCPQDPCDYGTARDNQGHGTQVASIIGAVADNNLGIAGIDQQCQILSGRIFTMAEQALTYPQRFEANAARAIIALETIATLEVYESVRVINISFSFPIGSLFESTIEQMEAMLEVLAAQNRFVVTGAGNGYFEDADDFAPARSPYVITVGAIDARGWRVNHEDSSGLGSSAGECVDFVAPGMAEVMLICQIETCDPVLNPTGCPYYMYGCNDFGRQANFQFGTSFAAPKVAGAISLILARAIELGIVCPDDWSGLTWDDVYGILRAGARDRISWGHGPDGDCCDVFNGTGNTSGDECYGWGLIDIDASLDYLETNYPPQNPPCP